jgi:hypothetical protein
LHIPPSAIATHPVGGGMSQPQTREHQDDAMSDDGPVGRAGKAMTSDEEFTRLDDSALLSRRAEMRTELERLPLASPGRAALTALYDKSTQEVNARATQAWARAGKASR